MGKIIEHYTGYDFRMWRPAINHIKRVARLTGFSYKKMFGHFARTIKTGCNNEVTMLTR